MSGDKSYRYKDPGGTIWRYMKDFFVECPKCSKRAVVEKEGTGYWHNETAKLKCTNCHYRQDRPHKYYDLEIKYYCCNCAERVDTVIEHVSVKKELINIKCPACSFSQKYKPRYIERASTSIDLNTAHDPIYKLPLWLSGEFRNNIFWAYNYEHLSHIKGHVGASLRTKIDRGYTTMLEKLPAWITSKKNRDGILKLIDRIEKK